MIKNIINKSIIAGISLAILSSIAITQTCYATSKDDYTLLPPFVSAGAPPLVMLVMGRNHKLYYEAYNDASDLNDDGVLDVGYKPDIDYYGYFDSFKYYEYNSTNGRFDPVGTTDDKKCPSSGNYWSGDFLNYLTMSRMDCLRKVLYGGYRSTDTTSETVLQRVYIPQDAHSWGKEYESVGHDNYDIQDYTPLCLPTPGTRHLFASTTLSDNGDPLLRVALNNSHRIWEWVAKERPVCDDSIVSGSGHYDSYPASHNDYENLVLAYANTSHLQGSQSVDNIDGSGNPFGPDGEDHDYYLTIFSGNINIATGGAYEFAVDGDDAVEVIINGTVVAGWYNGHGSCTCHTYSGTIDLVAGTYEIEFRHQERTGGDNYYLRWIGPDSTDNDWEIVPGSAFEEYLTQTVYDVQSSGSAITDYIVRVKVCDSSMPEPNSKIYPDGCIKPVGLLQRHGESERMYFGLLTGSYAKNTSGGVLRKKIGTITDEIDSATGQFTGTNGIINTINKFRIVGYTYSGHSYNCNCGWITTHPLNEGQCRMWGNPVAEMMYEGLRYFAGTGNPTSNFTYSGTTDDSNLGLPLPAWDDPYTSNEHCAKPFMLVISDINPTYDSDQLPGVDSNFGSGISTDLTGMNVSTLANTISSEENISGDYYIGQSGNNYDGAPTVKNVTGFGSIRGLAPEEPTKEGSYYSAGVAYYGRKTDINTIEEDQKVITYAVGLASPLPRITIPVGGQTVTLVPFGKSVGGYSINGNEGQFQPTNTIVDFFVDTITPTYGKFRINYEDVEQGADHDMDAIVEYEYTVNSDNTITITLTSTYAAGSIIQHLGYVISGTTADGAYLEVRDEDTASGDDPDYFLDTPPGQGPGEALEDGGALPITTSRTFTTGTDTAATLLKNPLWYAAKWGGFEEGEDGNNIPDKQEEWDRDMDGVPDTYFYVTNPLRLEEQLNKSFADILRRAASGTAASVISSTRSGEGAIYQSLFYPEYKGPLGNTVNWVGDVHALFVDAYGNMREDTNQNGQLDMARDADKNGTIEVGTCSDPLEEGDLIIKFDGSNVYKHADINGNGQHDIGPEEIPLCVGTIGDIKYLWSANNWLGDISDADITGQRSTYISNTKQRYIFTFVDSNKDMIPNSGEVIDFIDTESSIYPYLHLYPSVFDAILPDYLPADATDKETFINIQSKRIINYTRGQDQGEEACMFIPAFRSRQVDYNEDGTVDTWRLGDIIYSSPTVVAAPAEDFDLLYKDTSYTEFYRKYKNRRHVNYVGANDGMLHAFNGGFFDSSINKFYKGYNVVAKLFNDTGPDLGAELWAYAPYNLLPHLYWLTESDYNADYHVAYVDLKPRIFDAKIFTADDDHPDGWGTVLVCGMRFGGGQIHADTDKDNTNKYDDSGTPQDEPVMRSAFIIMDITNPENKPELLGEISFDGLGFTTCYPTVICMKDKTDNAQNDWYLVLGSGPIGSGANGPNTASLQKASSQQKAAIYIVNLNELVQNKTISLVNKTPDANSDNSFVELDDNSFVSDPVSVDYDLDYKADVVYFGTVSGDSANGWGGKLRRIVIENNIASADWIGDSILIDAGQPITAAPSVGMDKAGNRWVFFGTGRFFNRSSDVTGVHANDPQTYYGIKEPSVPLDPSDPSNTEIVLTWTPVSSSDLLDVSSVRVFDTGSKVEDTDTENNPSELGSNSTFDILMDKVAAKDGWRLNFPETGERNLGQAALLGDILLFTTYKPDDDACSYEGSSKLYGVYFKTGTAYEESVLGLGTDVDDEGNQEIIRMKDLGKGLVITPNIHTGREKGSKAFIQSSTGAIIDIEVDNPGATKSGTVSWAEE